MANTNLFPKELNQSLQIICEKMDHLIKLYNEIQDQIDISKKNDALIGYIDHFIPLLQDISKKSYLEYFKLIEIMARIDNNFVDQRKKMNDEIIALLIKQANKDGQNVLGIYNHPNEIKYDKIIEKVKNGMNGISDSNSALTPMESCVNEELKLDL